MDVSQSENQPCRYFFPRLKPFVEYSFAVNKILFFARPGTAIELEDAGKFIFTVCNLMDGEKSIEDIREKLSSDYPVETAFLEDLLSTLDNEGLIEDLAVCKPGSLSVYDVERWSRNIEFLGAYSKAKDNKYSHQEKIKKMKVCLLGLGGVGSGVLYNLVAMGVQNIRIVDFDNVELSNLNRQIIYDECDVGKSKAEAARAKILRFYPQANIDAFRKKVVSAESLKDFIEGCDIVINAADQPREHIIDWLNLACVNANIPFICGALDSRYAIYYSIIPGKTGCIECWKSSARKSGVLFQDFYRNEEFRAAESPNVTIMPFISIISGLMCADFLKIATNILSPLSLGKLNSFDFIDGKISTLESWGKDPNCSICNKG